MRYLRFGYHIKMDFSGGSDGKESACNAGDQGWEDPLEKWQPTPVLLPGKFHGWEEPGRLQSTGSQKVRHD